MLSVGVMYISDICLSTFADVIRPEVVQNKVPTLTPVKPHSAEVAALKPATRTAMTDTELHKCTEACCSGTRPNT
jgi:gamma-glutamyl:cysteine ligase YbdK (ATP-grasp superfamily)